MSKLFISYRRKSWGFTYWLVEKLGELLDAEIFVDYSGINESNFESALLRNLRDSDAVLLIVSEHTFDPARIHKDDDWVRREICEALASNKPMALACVDGLFPPADIPADIQAMRGVQGIEFYPRYFKAAVQELAAFLDRATPVKLRAALPVLPEPDTTQKSPKNILNDAISFHEAGQYEQAIDLYDQLIAASYRPHRISIPNRREKAIAERDAEQRRWEAGQSYDKIAALSQIDPARARAERAKFRARYPDLTDGPAGLEQKPKTLKPLVVLRGHDEQVNSVAFSPDGKWLASGGADNTVRLWNVAKRCEELPELKGHRSKVSSVTFSPDSTVLVSGGDNVRFWDVAEHSELAALTTHIVTSAAFSPDGKILAFGNYDTPVKLYSVINQCELATLTGHKNWVNSVAFSPDGTLLASGSADNTVRLWSVAKRSKLDVLEGHSYYIYAVAFSPDGKLLASGSGDKTVRLWDVARRCELAVLNQDEAVRSLAFSPDGTLLASGGWDNVRLWNIAKRCKLATVNHEDSVNSLAFSPDGRLLASAGDDQMIRLWEVV